MTADSPIPAELTSGRKKFISAALAALFSILLVVLRLQLWDLDLHVPVVYAGDALYETVLVKALAENGWNYHIARLDAPFGMDAVDFPIGCTLDQSVLKSLSFVIKNPFLLINLFWLLAIGAAAASAALFFQRLRVRAVASATFGALYGIIPFIFYRNLSHLTLIHFIVPAGAYIAWTLAQGESLPSFGKFFEPAQGRITRAAFILRLGLCLAIGLTYIYWAFFSCIALAIGCCLGFFRTKSKPILLATLIYGCVIGAAALADLTASFVYWSQVGPNTALNYKRPAEADIYGLKIRQMFTPIQNHPFPFMRTLRYKSIAAKFPYDDNEATSAALGLIGGTGFLLLLFAALSHSSGPTLGDQRLRLLGSFVIAFVLIAEVGGFGSLFNILFLHEFRAYNRISPFISLCSLGGLAIVVDRVLRHRGKLLQSAIAAGLLALGAFDQIPPSLFAAHKSVEAKFHRDRAFIRTLESRLPAGAMIFQLPHTGFPMDAGINERMGPYDNARAYLQSKTLRWSWGAMDGRRNSWAQETASLSLPDFLRRIVEAGFIGLLIDRNGFPETQIAALEKGGAEAELDHGGRWLYLDLRKLTEIYFANRSPQEQVILQDLARHPISVSWLSTFSTEERLDDTTWRWCGRRGIIHLENAASADQQISISASLRQPTKKPSTLLVSRGGEERELTLTDTPLPFRDTFTVKARSSLEISFEYRGDLLHVPADPRELAFQLQNFSLRPGSVD
ncbi:MAG: hypothetical protein ACR2ID_07240 [Chthoniobacterales bacterium]